MIDGIMDRSIATPEEAALRDELVRGDLALTGVAPVLTHMLAQVEAPLVNEAVIARVQGMLGDISRQLVGQIDLDSEAYDQDQLEQLIDDLVERFAEDGRLLEYCHSLVIEGKIAMQFQKTQALDPVLSPLFQELIASGETEIADLAMTTLTAQSRYILEFEKMALPINELPAELFHSVIAKWQEFCVHTRADVRMTAFEELRKNYSEANTRLGLLERLVASLGNAQRVALNLEHSGYALLATALGQLSGQDRSLAVLSCMPSQFARLALGLRAGRLADDEIATLFAQLHRDKPVPEGIGQILPDQAQSILRHSDVGIGR